MPVDVEGRLSTVEQFSNITIKADPTGGGAGYHHPPDPNAVYYPLFEPAVAQTGTRRAIAKPTIIQPISAIELMTLSPL